MTFAAMWRRRSIRSRACRSRAPVAPGADNREDCRRPRTGGGMRQGSDMQPAGWPRLSRRERTCCCQGAGSVTVVVMNWNSLGPAVFSLLGVALGTIGSLLGVYYAQRTAREQARLEHSAAMRIERRDIYLEYLSTVEKSWSFLDGLWGRQPITSADGVPLKDDDAVEREAAIRNHEVWYYQQKLALVASDKARNAALDLSTKLYEATFHRERVSRDIRNCPGTVMRSARWWPSDLPGDGHQTGFGFRC